MFWECFREVNCHQPFLSSALSVLKNHWEPSNLSESRLFQGASSDLLITHIFIPHNCLFTTKTSYRYDYYRHGKNKAVHERFVRRKRIHKGLLERENKKTKLGAEGSNNQTEERKKCKQEDHLVLLHSPQHTMDHSRKMSWKSLSIAAATCTSLMRKEDFFFLYNPRSMKRLFTSPGHQHEFQLINLIWPNDVN